jgi:hypothetical protein
MQTLTQDPVEGSISSFKKWLVLAVMSVGTLIIFLDNTVVNTALPTISVEEPAAA